MTAAIARQAAMQVALLRAEAAERAALDARGMLVDAIEAIHEGFVLHDPLDRLVLCATAKSCFILAAWNNSIDPLDDDAPSAGPSPSQSGDLPSINRAMNRSRMSPMV